ncbi:hypothetical protein T440DRAFT_206220 [Plenodomus tracheiphilus IPT5]|uniref:Uncharacterized protein n=1 Tax=Plenodomus tracheiphilus IPT5 TaxID=1408161 RepID=A0A6A7BL86_9PLEO|nr:hypothetical protein T440DRAFT_206220 [Plenodomus tracheiphilus IPT5]
MSGLYPQTSSLRNRRFQQDKGPPVPPKPDNPYSPNHGLPSESSALLKPLPPVPSDRHAGVTRDFEIKPLPLPPQSLSLKRTLYWILGFCLWFLLIVVLLPVITERDAMPGFSRWLRSLL